MRYLVVVLLVSVLLASCSQTAEKRAATISALEKTISDNAQKNISDTVKVKELLADYGAYYDHFPKDSMCPVYLMRSADFDRALGLNDMALICYHKVYTEYPGYPKASAALFLEAFMYDNEKHDIGKAKELYNSYLTKYPNSKKYKDVKFLLDHVGMSAEQIRAELDSVRKANDTTAVAKK